MKRYPSQRRRIVLHSENGPMIGGSDFYLGRIMDGLDPEHWEIYLLARPGYPIERVTDYPQRVTHLEFGPKLKSRCVGDCAGGNLAERPAELPCRPKRINQIWSHAPRSFRRDVGLLRDAKQAQQILEPIRPDLFHSVDGGPQPAVIGAVRAGAKAILGYSAPPPSRKNRGMCRWIEQRACQLASSRITKSDFARRDWAAYLRCRLDRFDVIPNGIDVTHFSGIDPIQAKRDLGLPTDKLIIGTTARLEKEKGADVFLQAAKILAHSDHQLHFVITGDGTLAESMRTSIRGSRLEDRITMLGHRQDIPTVTAAYDVAVVPSTWNEPFGWVVLEAMAASKPVIASRVGGIPEIVDEGKTGLLVKAGSDTDLISAIHRLKHDPDLRRSLGQRGFDRVSARFSRERMIAQTTRLYDQLCRSPGMSRTRFKRPQGETVSCGPR